MLMQQYVAMMILKLHESSVNRDCNRNRDRNKNGNRSRERNRENEGKFERVNR